MDQAILDVTQDDEVIYRVCVADDSGMVSIPFYEESRDWMEWEQLRRELSELEADQRGDEGHLQWLRDRLYQSDDVEEQRHLSGMIDAQLAGQSQMTDEIRDMRQRVADLQVRLLWCN